MTDGMKSGAGSDPFADDSDNKKEPSETSDETTQETTQASSEPELEADNHSSDGSERSKSSVQTGRDGLPYIFGRNGVKDDRQMVQYFLRDETKILNLMSNILWNKNSGRTCISLISVRLLFALAQTTWMSWPTNFESGAIVTENSASRILPQHSEPLI